MINLWNKKKKYKLHKSLNSIHINTKITVNMERGSISNSPNGK